MYNNAIPHNKLNGLEQFQLINIKENHQEEFFKPHRHDFYEIIYITNGEGKHKIDFKEYALRSNTIHLIQPSQIHEWVVKSFNNEYEGYIFLFSKELLPLNNPIDELFDFNTAPVIKLPEKIAEHIRNLIAMIENEREWSHNNIVKLLFNTILEYIARLKKDETLNCKKDERVSGLLELIESSFIDEKSASFYASRLNLTTKRLNELTKKYLNKTVSSLIIDRNIIEAKRELIYSNHTIAKLSEILGFKDSPQFIKYFKKYTSYTPTEFKKLSGF